MLRILKYGTDDAVPKGSMFLSTIVEQGYSADPNSREDRRAECNSTVRVGVVCYPVATLQSVSNANFGPLIAYLVPGATVLLGFSPFSSTLRSWFASTPADTPTLGGFLYLTVASLAVGMIVSAIRWALLDTLHAHTGLPMPALDFSKLGKNVEAFHLLIEIHYKHYLFYGNAGIACAIAYGCYRAKPGVGLSLGWPDVLFLVLEAILYVTSRDTLKKYYSRTQQLLRTRRRASG